MKKKGFTLIELLAVIVILAIIALIATPLVLKYIEKSRSESKVDSSYSYVRNLETEIANYSLKKNGKKFSVTPASGDYYVEDDFKDNEVDTKVKGDKPDSIKVCLSSLGQIEKGVFKYDKYYVSYDGKRGSITDKDTYNNFSCSGNGSTIEPVFSSKLTFAPYENYGSIGAVEGDYSNIHFSPNIYYNLIIDNNEPILVWGKDSDGDGYSDQLTASWWGGHSVSASNEGFAVGVAGEVLEGEHDVKIVELDGPIDPYVFAIDSDDRFWIYSAEFVVGDAIITIADTEGNAYIQNATITFSEMTPYTWGRPVYGKGYIELDALPNDILVNKKDIKVSVTQNIDGKDITTNFEFFSNKIKKIYDRDVYYWGNPFIECGS